MTDMSAYLNRATSLAAEAKAQRVEILKGQAAMLAALARIEANVGGVSIAEHAEGLRKIEETYQRVVEKQRELIRQAAEQGDHWHHCSYANGPELDLPCDCYLSRIRAHLAAPGERSGGDNG